MTTVTEAELERMLAILADAERGVWPEVVEEPLPPGLRERVWRRICERLGRRT